MPDSHTSSKNIGVMNLSSHENQLSDICSILSDRPITIFTTREIYDRLDLSIKENPTHEWVIKSPSERLRDYLRRVQSRSTAIDSLIAFPFYGDVFDYIQFSKFDPDCEYYLYIFNVNGWIGRDVCFTPKISNYFKYPLKQSILRKVNEILVEYPTIREYAKSHYTKLPIRSFTPVVSDPSSEGAPVSIDKFVVTIPGIIDKSRRDYDIVLSAIEKLENWQLNEVELVLLGTPRGKYGEKAVERAEKLQSRGLTTTTFTDWVRTKKFEQYLQSSDLLISPLVRTQEIDGFVEYYGLSKGSGAISDAIRYSLPLLLPEWYNSPETYASGIGKFGGVNDLLDVFNDITTHRESRLFEEGPRKSSESYKKEPQSKKLSSIISKPP